MSKSLDSELAIVIPFFKIYYLENLLLSLVAQTDKRFNLYIGDDASPHDIADILRKYNNVLQITYKRFDENLGSSSLVKHWHRSISMAKREKWIWLIGDDDMIDANCVKYFYSNVNDIHHVYRFSTRCINQEGRYLKKTQLVKIHQSRSDYLRDRLLEKHRVSLSECIFSRISFDSVGGFMEIPLAWSSDVVAWYMFSGETGIRGINASKVYLRTSEFNISSRRDNLDKKRFAMDNVFYKWVENNEPNIYKSTMPDRNYINDIRIMIRNGNSFFHIIKYIINFKFDVIPFTRYRGLKLLFFNRLKNIDRIKKR
jgi:hypothetical protein